MADFSKILSKPVSEAERPKPHPVGTWVWVITQFAYGDDNKNKTPYVRFMLRSSQPDEDVDQAQIAEAGGLQKLNSREIRRDFFLTEDSIYRLREFCENALGIDTSGRAWDAVIPECRGKQFKGHITHRFSQDGKDAYVQFDGDSPLD